MAAPGNARERLFNAAAELTDPGQRASFLDAACAGDPGLRAEIEDLLRHDDAAAGFLSSPALSPEATSGAGATEPPPAEPMASRIGPYKLLEPIGEGGMGTVYLAEQAAPVRRMVALKVIKAGMDSRQVLARFDAERQALALMDHPNIAKVLDAGATEQGRPYFVMELVKGQPITRFCDERRLTLRERLELFLPVCLAVQHAHQKGIIHRDLKPSNVLVGLYDGQPVPKVIDFGVAKATGPKLTEATLFTGFGAVVGTPEYMSPEQAKLDNLDVDTRSDVYSLGVLLYELLTGTTPLDRRRLKEAAILEILRVIREEEPPRPSTRLSTTEELPSIAACRSVEPRRLSGLMRGELDWIVMKALEKDRNRRYETANGLAADLRRYLDDEPVQACPPSAWYRFGKFARRNKAALIAAGLIAAAMLAAVVMLVVSNVLIARERNQKEVALLQARDSAKAANDQRGLAVANEKLARDRAEELEASLYYNRITLAQRELSADDLGRALELLDACPGRLRRWEWHYLKRLCRLDQVILRDKAKAAVNSVAFSPDGEHLAAACGDGTIKVWNCRTREVVQTLNDNPGFVYSVAFHPGGKHLATAGADRKVRVWDLATSKPVFECAGYAGFGIGTAYVVAFSPDGRRLAAGSDGAVNLWDWRNRQLPPIHTLPADEKMANSVAVAFSRDGRRLASGSWSGGVRIWDAETGERLHTLSEHYQPVSALAFSPDDGRLVSASFDGHLIVWDTTTGRLRNDLRGHVGLVLGVAFSPDGLRLASVGRDKTVRVWEAATGQEVLVLRGNSERSGCVAFSPDGWLLASCGQDATIRFWDATPLRGNEGQEALSFGEHAGEVYIAAISPDSRTVASAGPAPAGRVDAPVKVWDVRSGRVSVEFNGHKGVIWCVAWHPDGRRIASTGCDEEWKLFVVKVWDARTGQLVFALPSTNTETFAVAFSPDGHYLVTGGPDQAVQVWDARTGDHVVKLGAHDRVSALGFSRDGRHLASAGGDGTVKLWDATRLGENQRARLTLRAVFLQTTMNAAFSPDGRRLLTGGENNTVKIRDVRTGEELQTLSGHRGGVQAASFSPDAGGRWIAWAEEDKTVKVWDSHTGALVHSFRGHTGTVTSVAFSPDGRLLVSGSADRTVKVWDLTSLGKKPEE
jgi:WD40 repeat protein